jgi:2-dehydropantoate 2-reductase
MKITVVGLGAVGALIAARLLDAGHSVAALARGPTLDAVREHGIELIRPRADGERRSRHRLLVSDDVQALPAAELVVVALKGPAFAAAATSLAPLWADGAMVMPAMNGVPWWFMDTVAGGAAAPLLSVDPAGAIQTSLPLDQVLGCVVHLACSCPQPGTVRHAFGERLIVGEPRGGAPGPGERVEGVVAALTRAGFQAEASTDVRRDIWYKLWGNMTTNPISALTGASADRIIDDDLVRAFMARAMGEAAAIGERIGCPIAQSAEDRIGLTRQLGAFKTSMLQDAEAGRPLELDALVGAVREIGLRVGLDTPNIDALFGLTRLMGRQRGLYG